MAEIWFEDEPQETDADILRYYNRCTPMKGISYQESHAVLINMRQSPDCLLAGFDRNTRQEIRSAVRRYGFVYHTSDLRDPAVIDQFCDFHDRFAIHKGLPKVRRQYLKTLASLGVLDLSEVRARD